MSTLGRSASVFIALLVSGGLAGCNPSPPPPSFTVAVVDQVPAAVFPMRYGYALNGGDFIDVGYWVESPDRKARVVCERDTDSAGYQFSLVSGDGSQSKKRLFCSDDFEPGAALISLSYRVVWTGDSNGLLITAKTETSGPSAARVYSCDLAGNRAEIRAPIWGTNTVMLQSLPGTDLIVAQAVGRPWTLRIVNVDGAERAKLVAPDSAVTVLEDVAVGGQLVFSGEGLTDKPNPLYLYGLGSNRIAKIADGWCPRFVPGDGRVSYIGVTEGGMVLYAYDPASGQARPLAQLPKLWEVQDCRWESDTSVLVLCVAEGSIERTIYRVTLAPESN